MEQLPKYVFAALALLVGASAAVSDYKRGKIPNKTIAAGFIAGVVLHAVFIVYFKATAGEGALNFAYIGKLLLNAVIAFVCGFVLWKMSAWTAGDAKLFAVAAFLLPLDFYSKGYVEYFPSFNLLINIFACALVFVLPRILIGAVAGSGSAKATAGASLEDMWKAVSGRWHIIVCMFVMFNLIYIAVKPLRESIRGRDAQLLISIFVIVFMFAVMKPVSMWLDKLFEKRPKLKIWVLALIPAAALAAVAARNPQSAARNAKTIAAFMLFAGVFRGLIEMYLKQKDAFQVRVGDLKTGMVPTEKAIELLKDDGELQNVFMDGLSAEQVTLICERLDTEHRIEVYRTMPFAPLMLCGIILTMILKQSIVHFILTKL